MKITAVKTRHLTHTLAESLRFSMFSFAQRSIVIVEIETDSGVVGLGDVDSFPTGYRIVQTLIEEVYKPLLIGEDPLMTEQLLAGLFRRSAVMGRNGFEIYAISGIDMALLDIKAKVAGQPLYRLLGGSRREIKAYASLSYFDPDLLEMPLRRLAQEGFTAFKLRIGVEPEKDEEIVRISRKILGETAEIMVDVNCGWTRLESFRKARALEAYRLKWIEEPLIPRDLEGARALAAELDTPIALGEHHFLRYDFRRILEMGAADIVQPDLRSGGVSEVKKIADLASSWEVPIVPHVFGSGIRLAATLQVLCSCANSLYLEYDVSENPLRTEILRQPIKPVRGVFTVPEVPGIGVELNEEVVGRLED